MSLQQKIETLAKQHLDKVLHFFAGLFIMTIVYVCASFMFDWKLSAIIALVTVFVFEIAKELTDKFIRKTGFDWLDVLATLLGSIPPLMVILTDKM